MDGTLKIEELLREAGWLRALAKSLVGPTEADDLMQDTWVATLRHPPGGKNVRPWLARVVRNLARNARRNRLRREAREEFAHEEPEPARPEDLVQAAETQRLLAEAVTRLPEELGAVIVLRYFQGLDSGAAAKRLGVPSSTLRTRLQRALEALRADLDGRTPGGRRAWAAMLMGLARHEPALPVVSLGGLSIGALVASGIGAACLVGALALFSWQAMGREGEDDSAQVEVAASVSPTIVSEASHAPTAPRLDREALTATMSASTSEAPSVAAVATAEVSGTILVDGRPPEWTLELELRGKPLDSTVGPKEKVRPLRLTIAPDQRGAFRFGSLSDAWSGELQATGYVFASGLPQHSIDAPRAGLVLDLRSGPAIVGRVRLPDGRPARGKEGSYQILLGEADFVSSDSGSGFACRDDGRFRIPCETGDEWSLVALRIESDQGFLHCESPRFDPLAGFDFGELQLEPVRPLTFVARDLKGRTVPDVVARVVGALPGIATYVGNSMGRSSAPTDSNGSATLNVPDREVEVWFGAMRYAETVRAVGNERAIEVVLEPIATLDIRLAEDLVPRVRTLMIFSESPAFLFETTSNVPSLLVPSRRLSWRREPELPGDRYEYAFERGFGVEVVPGVHEWRPKERGRLSLQGIVPGVPLWLEARDGDGNVLASTSVAVGEREWGEVELRAP